MSRADFDPQPTLSGRAIRLRPLAAGDWADLFACASDPLVWEQHPIHERYREEVFRPLFDGKLAEGWTLAVERLEDARVVGMSSYSNLRDDAFGSGAVEIGSTVLGRACWGGAINAEMKRLMLAHALRFVGTVEFLIAEDNMRSRKAMAKIGGRLTDRIVETEVSGRVIPHMVYEITRADFERGPLTQGG
tara:strand:+ start:1256 stop:1825 length:570 start_codon:yes stop_codon:yes gene_type:complete